jgi:hypothetical protein
MSATFMKMDREEFIFFSQLVSLPHILGLLIMKSISKIQFVEPDTLNWGSTVYKICGKIVVMHRNKTLVLLCTALNLHVCKWSVFRKPTVE